MKLTRDDRYTLEQLDIALAFNLKHPNYIVHSIERLNKGYIVGYKYLIESEVKRRLRERTEACEMELQYAAGKRSMGIQADETFRRNPAALNVYNSCGLPGIEGMGQYTQPFEGKVTKPEETEEDILWQGVWDRYLQSLEEADKKLEKSNPYTIPLIATLVLVIGFTLTALLF